MGSIFRKIFAGLTAFFWADKKRLFLGLLASFWSVQHIACAYGTDEPGDICHDPSMNCTPVYDESKNDSTIVEYQCGNGERLSIEEGEQRNKAREESCD